MRLGESTYHRKGEASAYKCSVGRLGGRPAPSRLVVRAVVGATDSSAQFLRPVTESDVTRAEEGFEEVAGAQQRHGWGG